MKYDGERIRAEIAKEVSDGGLNNKTIRHEMPAMERILADLSGYEIPQYTKNYHPPSESYLSGYGVSKPSTANALLNNLSQRVTKNLAPVGPLLFGKPPIESTKAIAVGAQAVDSVKKFYKALGLLDDFYSGKDVVENRYALSSALYAQYLLEQAQGQQGGNQNQQPGEMIEIEGSDSGDGHGDDPALKRFVEWVSTLEPYMKIISKYIDKTIGAPTERIKQTRVQDDEGDDIDVIELDIMQIHRMTGDSLSTFAADRKWAALNIDDMTMEERYTTMTKKYIDVFVVDNSGSMEGEHIFRSAAYLYNRLEKVERGWAMLAVVEFDTGARTYQIPEQLSGDKPRWLIDTPQKARWAMKNIITRYANFSGGGTNIPAGVRQGISMSKLMEEQFNGHLPNITVITDDDTSISSMNPKDTDNIPVNGIAIKNNHPLQDFCIATGGTYYNMHEIELNVNLIKQREGL